MSESTPSVEEHMRRVSSLVNYAFGFAHDPTNEHAERRLEDARKDVEASARALASINAAEPCCGEFATCGRACTPRGEWIAQRRLVDPAKRLSEQAEPAVEGTDQRALLPCPFCGHPAKLHPAIRGYRACVECTNEDCGVGGPDYPDLQAPNESSDLCVAQSWNTRCPFAAELALAERAMGNSGQQPRQDVAEASRSDEQSAQAVGWVSGREWETTQERIRDLNKWRRSVREACIARGVAYDTDDASATVAQLASSLPAQNAQSWDQDAAIEALATLPHECSLRREVLKSVAYAGTDPILELTIAARVMLDALSVAFYPAPNAIQGHEAKPLSDTAACLWGKTLGQIACEAFWAGTNNGVPPGNVWPNSQYKADWEAAAKAVLAETQPSDDKASRPNVPECVGAVPADRRVLVEQIKELVIDLSDSEWKADRRQRIYDAVEALAAVPPLNAHLLEDAARSLHDAMWQLLSDFGDDGHSVCEQAKREARDAYDAYSVLTSTQRFSETQGPDEQTSPAENLK